MWRGQQPSLEKTLVSSREFCMPLKAARHLQKYKLYLFLHCKALPTPKTRKSIGDRTCWKPPHPALRHAFFFFISDFLGFAHTLSLKTSTTGPALPYPPNAWKMYKTALLANELTSGLYLKSTQRVATAFWPWVFVDFNTAFPSHPSPPLS